MVLNQIMLFLCRRWFPGVIVELPVSHMASKCLYEEPYIRWVEKNTFFSPNGLAFATAIAHFMTNGGRDITYQTKAA